jgi:hypothetical protein
MRHLRIFGLILVAVFALSAVAVSSASAALPEFHGPFPKLFTGLGGAGKLEAESGNTVSCKDVHIHGEIIGPKHDLVKLTYLGCSVKAFGATAPCATSGQPSGVVLTNKLLSLLGYIKRTPRLVGLLLEPEAGQSQFASFECVAGVVKIPVQVRGTVGGEIGPLNTLSNSFNVAFELEKVGKQKIKKFEGEGEMKLEISFNGGTTFEGFGIENSATLVLANGEEGEILA